MDKDGFYTINEIEKLLQQEDFCMNLTTWNRFLLQRFVEQIELVEADDILQLFTKEDVDGEVLRDAVLYCHEQALENNDKVDRGYRTYYKMIEVMRNFVDEHPDNEEAFQLYEALQDEEDFCLYRLYEFVENNLDSLYLRRLLIATRAMQTKRG